MSATSNYSMFIRGLRSNSLVRKTILNKAIRKACGKSIDNVSLNLNRNNCLIHLVDIEKTKTEVEKLYIDDAIIQKYLNHEFNLLGSGWICWKEGTVVQGYRGCKVYDTVHFESCAEKDDTAYHNIAWNVDIRSGYVFRKCRFDSELVSQLPDGVEIKVPWELGRMYHWPYLALYALKSEKKIRDTVSREFLFQMTDYMAHNPVGEGVQFYCGMEVAIRAVNLLFAYDIIKQIDMNNVLKEDFCYRFEKYLFSMAKFIEHNIEYDLSGKKNGNHYLSDLLGLIWIYSYFGKTKALKKTKELFFGQIIDQFLADGSNFECSISYHRLSTEISVLGSMLILKCFGEGSIPDDIKSRIMGMKRLLCSCVGSDGRLTQIGDNDSGKVLKPNPIYDGDIEDTLRIEDTLNLIDGLFQIDDDCFSIANCYDLPALCACRITKNIENNTSDINDFLSHNKLQYQKETVIHIRPGFSFEHREYVYEEKFGLINVRGKGCNIFIRTLPIYSEMNIAHAHEDVFHYELCFDKQRQYADCGSVSYTSNAEESKLYRSVKGHNVPIHEHMILEKKEPFEAIFDSTNRMDVLFGDNSIILDSRNSRYRHVRAFVFTERSIIVCDYSNDSFNINLVPENRYSLGYGHVSYHCQK